MVNRAWLMCIFLCFSAEVSAQKGLESLVLQLRWVTQAQFAGYYVALDRGIYERYGLDVTILPGGPNLSGSNNLVSGAADITIEWLPHALVMRNGGVPLVNIAQIFHRSGYTLSCRRDRGIQGVADLQGRRIGSWFVGDEVKIKVLLGSGGIEAELYPLNFNLNDLISGEADCISTMRYNEYLSLLEKGMDEKQITTFDFDQLGVSILEDGLYVLEEHLQDEMMRSRLSRFVAATIEGWLFTLDHPDEALEIVLDNDPTGALDEEHERNMLKVISTLLHHDRSEIGRLRPEQYVQTVNHLLIGGELLHSIHGGYTDVIWLQAQQLE